MTQHSPEPWSVKHNDYAAAESECEQIVDANNHVIESKAVAADRENDGCWHGFTREDARRIVACVNACNGIPTEAIGPLMDIIREELKHSLVGGLHNTEPFVTEWKRKALAVLEEHGWETEQYT